MGSERGAVPTPGESPQGAAARAPARAALEPVIQWAGERFGAAFEAVPCGMFLTDAAGFVVAMNQEATHLFGFERGELVGQPLLQLVPPRLRDSHRAARSLVLADPREGLRIRGRDAVALRRDGTEFPVIVGLNPIDSPFGTLILSSVVDIRDRVRAEIEIRRLHAEMQERVRRRTARLRQVNEQLRAEIESRSAIERELIAARAALEQQNRDLQTLAMHDPLTGLHNRRHLDQALEAEWRRASRSRRPLSLLMIDIDYFKQLNDAQGHAAGDACLQQIALALRGCVRRPSDVVARHGGEEFAILLPETGRDGALALAAKIRARVLQLAIPHPTQHQVTVSIGVCCRTASFEGDHRSFLESADAALYRAKAAGRNCVRAAPKNAARRPAPGEGGGASQ
jgi:diguanylate cyclase (GGDEF)-like protein/PAS domain S-box-containing protein